MNCKQVQSLLVAYINNEVTPSERVLVQAHLLSCATCAELLSRYSSVQGQISSVLQSRGNHVQLSSDAWTMLEARLSQEPVPEQTLGNIWPASWISTIGRIFSRSNIGEFHMNKQFSLATGGVVLVIAIIAFGVFSNVSRVSANSILKQASQAINQEYPKTGILHTRLERYSNFEGLPEEAVAGTIDESYHDLASCNVRRVTTNTRTGVVLDVHTNDGSFIYGGFDYDIDSTGPLVVYHSPVDPGAEDCYHPVWFTNKDMFDEMNGNPDVTFLGEETWADGRSVYVLDSKFNEKMIKDGKPIEVPGTNTVYFDTETYRIMGGKAVITREDGSELVIKSSRYLIDEILPADTPVNWNVTGVDGLKIIEDPDGTHRDDGARG
jgi:hypothetical protein